MAKKHECPEPENTERWAVSYLDMITVMMCLFLVLYAISQVDQGKLAKLRASLAAGFNSSISDSPPIITSGGLGILMGSTSVANLGSALGSEIDSEGASSPERMAAAQEASHLKEIEAKLKEGLAAVGQEKAVDFRITEKGLVLGMVASDAYFKPGDATLEPAAQQVLEALSPVLSQIHEQIGVEGYADTTPQYSARYPNNDYLSSGRANEVLVFLKSHGVPGNRLRSISYGSDHQTEVQEGQDALAINRRVDIVIMSKAKEAVRELLKDAGQNGAVAIPTPQITTEVDTVH